MSILHCCINDYFVFDLFWFDSHGSVIAHAATSVGLAGVEWWTGGTESVWFSGTGLRKSRCPWRRQVSAQCGSLCHLQRDTRDGGGGVNYFCAPHWHMTTFLFTLCVCFKSLRVLCTNLKTLLYGSRCKISIYMGSILLCTYIPRPRVCCFLMWYTHWHRYMRIILSVLVKDSVHVVIQPYSYENYNTIVVFFERKKNKRRFCKQWVSFVPAQWQDFFFIPSSCFHGNGQPSCDIHPTTCFVASSRTCPWYAHPRTSRTSAGEIMVSVVMCFVCITWCTLLHVMLFQCDPCTKWKLDTVIFFGGSVTEREHFQPASFHPSPAQKHSVLLNFIDRHWQTNMGCSYLWLSTNIRRPICTDYILSMIVYPTLDASPVGIQIMQKRWWAGVHMSTCRLFFQMSSLLMTSTSTQTRVR